MTATQNVETGRVLRVGRGWIDVTVDRKIRRMGARPDLLIRAGCYIRIFNDNIIAVLPPSEQHTSRHFQ